jgi:GDP-mannose 6-dehydrogenase
MALRICVCGLGYVGAVTAACLAELGHSVVGVDVATVKVEAINRGQSHFVEAGLPELIRKTVSSGRLHATTELEQGVATADLILVCVGTPSRDRDGGLSTEYVERICREIGACLRTASAYAVVAVRSTVSPGLTRTAIVPWLEQSSGKKPGVDFGVCFNPEFLREGAALEDFFNPSRTVIGELDQTSGDMLVDAYRGLPGTQHRTSFETAELVKYADNWWHALKVTFANEVGTIAQAVGVDAAAVMDLFVLDQKLNISPKYLSPGVAFGGSCLPKDLRALQYLAHESGLHLPLLRAVIPSNDAHHQRALARVKAAARHRIGVLGLTFKPGTDDVRESPAVDFVARMVAAGLEVKVHDRSLHIGKLVGANRDYLLERIPDLADRLLDDAGVLCRSVELVVVMHDVAGYYDAVQRNTVEIFDYARLRFMSPHGQAVAAERVSI